MQTINIAMLLASYAQGQNDTPKVHFLVIPNPASLVQYAIRCNGAKLPRKRLVTGIAVPLILTNEIPIRQIVDHHNGCSNLNTAINRDLVETYCTRLERFLPKIYREPGLTLHIDPDRIDELVEGFTPILISGKTITGLQFDEPTPAIIASGNCV
jgi:hypothetical protein